MQTICHGTWKRVQNMGGYKINANAGTKKVTHCEFLNTIKEQVNRTLLDFFLNDEQVNEMYNSCGF